MAITQPTFERISTRGFDLSTHDLRDLRARVRRLNQDIPMGLVNTMNRRACVRMLLANEFGTKLLDKYEQQCKEWDECRAFSEFGVNPKRNKKRKQ